MKRKNKSRLEKPKKQYPDHQSALFGLKGLGQLREALLWNASQGKLERVAGKPSSYKVWINSEGREVQEAIGELRKLHVRIATLLRRIEPPRYRHSGVRGRSYITNGAEHAIEKPSLKLDIQKYFPSTTFKFVYTLFRESLQCAEDVAVLLARICCFRDTHLPTGGVHSEVVAFYAHKPLFDRLAQRAAERGGVFTVYIDDMMMTFDRASASDLRWVENETTRHGLILHPRKSRVVRKREAKTITGVRILGREIRAPQRNHQKLHMHFQALELANQEGKETVARRLLGQIDQIAQIDERFHNKAKGNRARLSPLLR